VLDGYKLANILGQEMKSTYVKPKKSGQFVLFRKLRPSRHASLFYLYTMVCIMGMQSVMPAGNKPRHVHWQELSYLARAAKLYG
jgi:hypothetical protein